MNLDVLKQNINEILGHYPPEVRPLILHQVITIISFMEDEKELYSKNLDVRQVVDKILTMICEGRFILGVEK